MNLKIFIIVLINAIWALIPQNIIGCGPEPDPKDYYTSFFTNALVPDQSYKPFFYTTLLKFYDDYDWMDETNKKNVPDALITEWQDYVSNQVTLEQIEELVYNASDSVIQYAINNTAGIKTKIPSDYAAFSGNEMLSYLLKQGKKDALSYLVFAKQVQQLIYAADPWEAPQTKDSLKLMKLFRDAERMQAQIKDPFIQNKYSFMQCRLAFYAGNYPLCIRIADRYFGVSTPVSSIKVMAAGYKAGSYFKTGKNAEAALWFARAFQMSPENRKKNYLGFLWSTGNGDKSIQPSIISNGADNKEKAFIAGLFGLHGVDYGLENMKKVYSLDPQCELLPLLIVREIEKLEEQYLSPMLAAQKGAGELFYADGSKPNKEQLAHAEKVLIFIEQLAADQSLSQNQLYKVCAAYTAYIAGKNEKAKQWAADTYKNRDDVLLWQQALVIQLLTTISGYAQMNNAAEAELLPLLQTLFSIAETDMEYRVFMRNLYVQVLAPKYAEQGDMHKSALCFGVANMKNMSEPAESNSYYYAAYGTPGIDYVRNDFSTEQAIGLYNFLKKSNLTAFEKFIIEKSSFGKDEVADFIGTSYLRDYAWKDAIGWLQNADNKEYLIGFAFNQHSYEYDSVFVNPFHDYLNDWQRYEKALIKPMDKLDFARKMIALEYQLDTITNKAEKGKIAYLLGSAYYNISYYGNSWMALDYDRSTYLWNNGQYTGWRKEYFEVQKARHYYQMAYELSGENKEFQAAAFFLVAKCAQRQIPRPDYNYNDWTAADKAEKEFMKKFMNNPLFSQFKKEFGTTKFYKYTLTRCTYLADFDKRK